MCITLRSCSASGLTGVEFAALKFDLFSEEGEEVGYVENPEMDHYMECVDRHERAECSEPRFELEDSLLGGRPNRIVR